MSLCFCPECLNVLSWDEYWAACLHKATPTPGPFSTTRSFAKEWLHTQHTQSPIRKCCSPKPKYFECCVCQFLSKGECFSGIHKCHASIKCNRFSRCQGFHVFLKYYPPDSISIPAGKLFPVAHRRGGGTRPALPPVTAGTPPAFQLSPGVTSLIGRWQGCTAVRWHEFGQ